MEQKFETVIGLEIHIELSTNTKIFCDCPAKFGGKPNSYICPVCTGMPGSLPVLNKKVVEYAIAVGLALNCDISHICQFDRKNYFYPDNPQNYQISQLYMPICQNGYIEIDSKKIRIHEIHMEEDAGKLIHDEDNAQSFIDYNRSGVPLIEIVTEPDMKNAEEVVAFLEKLRLIIQYLEVSDCKLNEGSMRVDVNLSVKKSGSEKLGTRTEMKNLNSFKAIKRAIENEEKRQINLINDGKQIEMETRRWDDLKEMSYSMRSKEDVKDYRYFQEPDLLPLLISDEWIRKIKLCEPEFRDEKIERYVKNYGISIESAKTITLEKALTKLFEETVELGANPRKTANYIIGETMRILREREIDAKDIKFSIKNFADLISLDEKQVINSTVAKQIFEKMFEEDINPSKFVEENRLAQNSNETELKDIIEEVLKNNMQSVNDYKNGKTRAIGYIVGQVMKNTKGKANPEMVNTLLKEMLGC